jgi:hypothetical protein
LGLEISPKRIAIKPTAHSSPASGHIKQFVHPKSSRPSRSKQSALPLVYYAQRIKKTH